MARMRNPILPSRCAWWSGYAPGGSVDIVRGLVAQKLTESLGQQFVVETARERPAHRHRLRREVRPDGIPCSWAARPRYAVEYHLFAKMPFDRPRI